MPISNPETVPTATEKLIAIHSKSLFFKMNNVFKNRTTFSILMWLYENEVGLNVEDIIVGFNLSRASAFRYCRMLSDANVVERIWDVTEKDIRAYARNRFVISEYGKTLIDTLISLERTTEPIQVADSESKKEWNLRNQAVAKLEKRLAGRLAYYKHTKRFEDIIFRLLKDEYADIKGRTVHIIWDQRGANAAIVWSQNKTDVIRCNRAVAKWPEPAIIGLLSHELSHIALGSDLHSEYQTDEDVIKRGLGHYLAIERAVTKKFTDHILKDGKDRYLAYSSIRNRLKSHQLEQLDRLISDLGMGTEGNVYSADDG
ncbi:MAG: hypothetical protein ACXADF_17710 [Candidatus Thorarchaeota archaeon]|jgi:hypothetical protein